VGNDWRFLIVLWSVSLVVVVAGTRPISDGQLTKWSIRFNVLIHDGAAAMIRPQLRRARAIRWTAFVVGVNIGMLPMYMNVIDVERSADFSNELTVQAPFIAAALGSVAAELAFVRRHVRARRTAAVTVRRWTDYVPALWVRCVALCVPISLVAAIVATARVEALRPWAWPWVGPIASALALAAMTIGVHHVVNRPSSAVSEQDLRLDDALRADGVHHIVGASFAMAGAATSSALTAAFGGVLGVASGLAFYAVIGVWYSLAATERWNVDQARLQRV
jgi:hypothetical protein